MRMPLPLLVLASVLLLCWPQGDCAPLTERPTDAVDAHDYAHICQRRGAELAGESHCKCPLGSDCYGSACRQGTTTSHERVVGFNLLTCVDCRCLQAHQDLSSANQHSLLSNSAAQTGNTALEKEAYEQQVDRLTSAKNWKSTMPSFVFLKFHKVGSTTVAVTLERLARFGEKKLCGRQENFFPSLPCQAWTTHDTEYAMVLSGLDSLRFFVGGKALALTILRHPVDRLLSRFYYDRVLTGETGAMIPTYQQMQEWLEERVLERSHYLRTLSMGSMRLADAMEALRNFDLVGVSDRMDDFMVMLAFTFRVPLRYVTYKNEKVVVGRPGMEDLPIGILRLLEENCAEDMEIYKFAQRLVQEAIGRTPNFVAAKREFQRLEAEVDQRCTFTDTNSKILTGKDCYQLT
eukprot:m.6739 g.6739  ORF g.6739 m.6739 type:complete len:405 (+) comp4923_c0_seq2:105-1319(+)